MKFVEFSNRLLIWHFHNKKKFGWRETKDPYKILISEILLHKTDSKKVEKVYPKFIDKFPTIYHLYQAEPEEIDDLIKDIGLFYRGQRLKKIAEQIVNKFTGNIPTSKEDLMSLYGVGEYISNAVLCFAFKNSRSSILKSSTPKVDFTKSPVFRYHCSFIFISFILIIIFSAYI